MRILYAVQATGNGHISRARDVVPLLKLHGDVDVFLSGSNAHLEPGFDVKYRSRGLSLYYNSHGGLNYFRIAQNAGLWRLYKEALSLPVEKYDIIMNDYECITSLACRIKRKSSTQFGHQASYMSDKVPRPLKKDPIGEFVLKKYAVAMNYIGLHFWPYDRQIFTPIIREKILNAEPTNQGYITVYLSHYSAQNILDLLKNFKDFRFQVFTGEVQKTEKYDNVAFHPIDSESFTQSMIHCHGVITGAGFETPAEVLFLNKKLILIPIHAQYEQLCNAAALSEWNVPVINFLKDLNTMMLTDWYNGSSHKPFNLLFSNKEIVDYAVNSALALCS